MDTRYVFGILIYMPRGIY